MQCYKMEIYQLLTKPEFYDNFGVFIFSYLSLLSGWMLWTKKRMPRWAIYTLLIIGILGIIVDGTLLTKFYFFRIG